MPLSSVSYHLFAAILGKVMILCAIRSSISITVSATITIMPIIEIQLNYSKCFTDTSFLNKILRAYSKSSDPVGAEKVRTHAFMSH